MNDGKGQDGAPFLPGLIDVQKLAREGLRSGTEGLSAASKALWSGHGRPSVGPWSGGGRGRDSDDKANTSENLHAKNPVSVKNAYLG